MRWPDDHELTAALTQRPLATRRSRAVITSVTAITEQLQGPDGDAVVRQDGTLEHIMPLNWQRNWPLPDHAGANQKREDAIRMLGNLTLLHSAPHAKANTGGWPQKRYALAQSKLVINQPLAALWIWYEAAIRVRAAELAQIACQIRPKPQPAARLI